MTFIEEIKTYKPRIKQEESDKTVILNYIDKYYKNILLRENKIAHITSSGLILNKSLNRVLMIHHNIYKTWAWTGGHADGDSNLLNVAIKEAKEETGLKNIVAISKDIASIDILPVYGHIKRNNYVSAHLHLNISFILLADEKEELVINKEETSGVKWIDVSKISEYSNEPYLIKIYNKIIEKAAEFK